MDLFIQFIVANRETIGLAAFGVFVVWMLRTCRLLTLTSFDKQLDKLRAADSAEVELHK